MSCRTEKEGVSLSPERLVLNVYRHCVGSLVLECERDVVFHSILGLVCLLDLGICLFEEVLMFRRNRHDKVCCSVFISHIVLSLNEMLCESRTYFPVGILMEFEDTLRLRAISETFVSKGLRKNGLSVFRTFACLCAEEFRCVECE